MCQRVWFVYPGVCGARANAFFGKFVVENDLAYGTISLHRIEGDRVRLMLGYCAEEIFESRRILVLSMVSFPTL